MRVLFWGTPDFAVPALRALVEEGFDVLAVVTQPDKPQGRSRTRLLPPPVKTAAIAEGIRILQPEDPRAPDVLRQIADIGADISAVVAYGHILPRAILDAPPRGSINVHASLLPALRGAAPIPAAIREGMTQTGVTVIRLIPALDAGPILLQRAIPIAPDETGGELQLRLSELGAQTLVEALTLIEVGAAAEHPQDDAVATYAPKIDRTQTRIAWTDPADVVARSIRAYDPRPGAFTTARGKEVKCFDALPTSDAPGGAPGEVTAIGAEGLAVACGAGAVRIAQVQPAGRPRMRADAWARGRGVAVGDRFE